MTLGPEFSPLVQRYAGHMQKAKDIFEIGVLLIAYGMDLKAEDRKRCEGTGNDEEVTECDRDLPTAADVRGILSVRLQRGR